MSDCINIDDDVVEISQVVQIQDVELLTESSKLETTSSNEIITVNDNDTIIVFEEVLPQIIEIANQGAQGITGEKGDSGDDATGFVSGNSPVLIGETKLVDFSTDVINTEWDVILHDVVMNMYRYFRVSGMLNDSFCVYGIKGDVIRFKADVTNMQLRITNNHNTDIIVKFSKTSIGI